MSDAFLNLNLTVVAVPNLQHGLHFHSAAGVLTEGVCFVDGQGLKLAVKDIRLTPVLLAKLAQYAADKAGVVPSIITLLPDLCKVGEPH